MPGRGTERTLIERTLSQDDQASSPSALDRHTVCHTLVADPAVIEPRMCRGDAIRRTPTMIAKSQTYETLRRPSAFARIATAVRSFMEATVVRLRDITDAGQLGPAEGTTISRHTGGRI